MQIQNRIVNKLFNYKLRRFYKKVESLGESLGGMTVNERLYLTGIMKEFDYYRIHDREKAGKILRAIKVDEHSIELILE